MPRRITAQTVTLWRERVHRYHHSDLSVEAFCREEGVSTTSLYNWRKKLSHGEPVGGAVGPCVGTFEPVGVIPSTAGMVVVLPRGVRIEIGAGQLDMARAVVGELTQGTPC